MPRGFAIVVSLVAALFFARNLGFSPQDTVLMLVVAFVLTMGLTAEA
jgi:hypothetical protein